MSVEVEKVRFTSQAFSFFSKALFVLAAAYGAIALTLLQVFLTSDQSNDVKLVLSSNIVAAVKIGFLICILGVICNLYTKFEPNTVKYKPIADKVAGILALFSTFSIWYLSAYYVPSIFLERVISSY